MPSLAQRIANTENAKLSTGPKTVAGKARSAINRVSHGFYSSQIVVPGEDEVEFQSLCKATCDTFDAHSGFARVQAVELATTQWKLQRLFALEAMSSADIGVSQSFWNEHGELFITDKPYNISLLAEADYCVKRLTALLPLIRHCERRINELIKSLRAFQADRDAQPAEATQQSELEERSHPTPKPAPGPRLVTKEEVENLLAEVETINESLSLVHLGRPDS